MTRRVAAVALAAGVVAGTGAVSAPAASAMGTAHQGFDTCIQYNCSGTGTQTWRTTISGTTIGGSYKFKESNHLRVYCG
ncbi:hypothetical protein AB0G15_33830 [Streptosporangium sp. NPDC023825]|uniref:hypothetical protein n=1 Tax=Streptosporangium sp. NPDC023825 TaxID=3154909 RepID=UPI003436218F